MIRRRSCVPITSIAVVLLLGLVAAGCGGTTTTASTAATTAPSETTTSGTQSTTTVGEQGDIIVGAVYGTTGKCAGGEAGIGNGARMAIEEVNAAGGVNGRKLTLVVEDTGS